MYVSAFNVAVVAAAAISVDKNVKISLVKLAGVFKCYLLMIDKVFSVFAIFKRLVNGAANAFNLLD